MFIKKVIQALLANRIDYALVGGYAVSLHGAVRGTVDVDLVVSMEAESLLGLERAMNSLGLVSRLPVSAKDIAQFRDEYINKRNLKAWSFTNPNLPTEVVDVTILYDLSQFKVISKKTIFGEVRLVSIGDLIRMKKEAGRPQDLADIEALQFIQKESRGEGNG